MKSIRNGFCFGLLSCLAVAHAFAQDSTTPAIDGVVTAGTSIQLVKEGFKATEGPVRQDDGGVLFTDNAANQILRIAPDGSITPWIENTGGANALARTPKGQVIATLVGDKVIAEMKPGTDRRVLAKEYEGKPFNRPNDIVASRRGNLYFTDTAAVGATSPALPSAVYQLTSKGKLLRIATDIARPNGIALSPDERTLYVANTSGEWIVAFDVDRKGGVSATHRDFARLALPAPAAPAAGVPAPAGPPTSGADGIAVDAKGRLFVATTVGVQVISPEGKTLGTIVLPKTPQNLAFGGLNRSALYVVGRGAVYRIATQTSGVDRAGK